MARWSKEQFDKHKAKPAGSAPTKWGVKKYSLYVGIDAGTNTGLAIWNKDKKDFDLIATLKIHRALDKIRELHEEGNSLMVRVEDARLRKWFGSDEEAENKQQGAGSVKRDSKIWEDFLTDHGIPYEMVAPAANMTKLDKEHFIKLTKYTGLTSEHGRDAAMLVFNY